MSACSIILEVQWGNVGPRFFVKSLKHQTIKIILILFIFNILCSLNCCRLQQKVYQFLSKCILIITTLRRNSNYNYMYLYAYLVAQNTNRDESHSSVQLSSHITNTTKLNDNSCRVAAQFSTRVHGIYWSNPFLPRYVLKV